MAQTETIKINRTSDIEYIFERTLKAMNGYGQSKVQQIKTSSLVSLSDKPISDKLHTKQAKYAFKKTGEDLNNFLRDLKGGNTPRAKDMTAQNISAFIEHQISTKDVRTVKGNITALNRLKQVIEYKVLKSQKSGKYAPFTTETLKVAQSDLKIIKSADRAFKNPTKVIENIKNPTAQAIATIQNLAGVRIHDAVNATEHLQFFGSGAKGDLRQPHNRRISVSKSKAGKNYTTFNLNMKQAIKVREALEIIADAPISQKHYEASLRKAAIASGETSRSSHSFRYNYAQRIYKITNSFIAVSKALGHERPEITAVYVSTK